MTLKTPCFERYDLLLVLGIMRFNTVILKAFWIEIFNRRTAMIIPVEKLDKEVLHNLIEEFITREGTDYGLYEVDLAEKVKQVKQQLVIKEVLIIFDEATETVNLVTQQQYKEYLME